MKSDVPVMNDDASEARKTTAPVSSSSSPQRPIGMLATNCWYACGSFSSCLFMSVANGPGQIALHVTPLPAHSRPQTRVRPSTPALDEAYGVRPGKPITDRIDARLMTRPQPFLSIPGANALVTRN